MRRDSLGTRLMGLAGLVGGAAVIILPFVLGDTFGYPGSAAYVRYQTYNRLMGICLLLASFAFFGIYWQRRGSLTRLGRAAFIVTVVGLSGIIAGNVSEFWLFTAQPYGVFNMRSVAFAVFLLGLLLLGVGSLLGGIALWRASAGVRMLPVILLAVLPLTVLTVMLGPLFLSTGLAAAVLGGVLLAGSPRLVAPAGAD